MISSRRATLVVFAMLLVCALGAASAQAAERFVPVGEGTFDVPGAAESMDVSPDGMRLAYSNPEGGAYLMDIADPTRPRVIGHDGGETTSIAFTPDGRYVLATNQDVPASRGAGVSAENLRVMDGENLEVLARFPIPGGDSIHVSPDGKYAAIANEQDGNTENGSILILDMGGAPSQWSTRNITLNAADPAFWGPENPFLGTGSGNLQPEYVDITADDKAAVSVQEANAIVVVDLPTATVEKVISAGSIDTTTDTGKNTPWSWSRAVKSPRMPDAIAWLPGGRYILAASEGEQDGYDTNFGQSTICKDCSGRAWTIYDSQTGQVSSDGGLGYEQAVARMGDYPRTDALKAGLQPEGADVATFGGHTYGFVVNERGASMAVLNLDQATAPQMTQLLPTGARPEVVVGVPARNLVFASGEKGEGTISVFRLQEGGRSDTMYLQGAPGTYLSPLGGLGASADGGFFTAVSSGDALRGVAKITPAGNADDPASVSFIGTPGQVTGTTAITDVAAAEGGGMWVATTNTIRLVAADGTVGAPISTPVSSVAGLAVAGGKVYAISTAWIMEYDPTTTTWVKFHTGIAGGSIADADATPDGRIALLTFFNSTQQYEVWRVGVAGLAAEATPTDVARIAPIPGPLPNGQPNTLLAVRPDGTVWVGGEASSGNGDAAIAPVLYGLHSLGRLFAASGDDEADGSPALAPPSPTPVPVGPTPANFNSGLLTPDGAYFDSGSGTLTAEQVGGFAALQTNGLRDPAFPIGSDDPNGSPAIFDGVPDGSGGAFLYGNFSRFDNEPHSNLVHVLANGETDPDFPVDQPDGPLGSLAVANGKLYISGAFSHVGAAPREHLAAIDVVTGLVDPNWAPSSKGVPRLETAGGSVYAFNFEQPVIDGGVTSTHAVAKLDGETGAIDAAFAPPLPLEAGELWVNSVAFAGDQMWVSGSLQLGGQSVVLAGFDRNTGALLPGVAPIAHSPSPNDSGPSQIAVDGEDLVAVGRFDHLGGVDVPGVALVARATGAVRSSGIPITIAKGQSGPGAVLVDGGQVYLGGDFLLANGTQPGLARFDASTFALDKSFLGTAPGFFPGILPLGGGRVAITGSKRLGTPNHGVFRIDPETGRLDLGFNPELPVSTSFLDGLGPMVGDAGRLYVTGADHNRILFKRLDPTTGAVVPGFAPKPLGTWVNAVVLDGDRIYVAGDLIGGVEAFDAETGARIGSFAPGLPDRVDAMTRLLDGSLLVAYEGDPSTPYPTNGAVVLDPQSGAIVAQAPAAVGARKLVPGPGGSAFASIEAQGIVKLNSQLEPDGTFELSSSGMPQTVQVVGDQLFLVGSFVSFSDGAGHMSNNVAIADARTGELAPMPGEAAGEEELAFWNPQAGLWTPAGIVLGEGNLGHTALLTTRISRVDADTLECDTSGVISQARHRQGGLAVTWFRDGTEVGGVSGSTYDLTGADAGTAISCLITPDEGTPVFSGSYRVDGAPPTTTAQPSLASIVRPGEEATCSGASFGGAQRVGYIWFLNDKAIPGATGATYRVADADAGSSISANTLRCAAVAANAAGSTRSVSQPAMVRALALAPTARPVAVTAPSIGGAATVGDTLTCTDATWQQALGADSFTWMRDGVAVGEGATHAVSGDDVGHRVTCVVSASNGFGSTSAESAAVTPVEVGGEGPSGPAGPAGSGGPAGANGSNGATGATGASGATGATGTTGATGPKGDAGARGARGEDGEDAKVTCKVVKVGAAKKSNVNVTCKVSGAKKSSGHARLTRGGRTYASGPLSQMKATKKVTAGSYQLHFGGTVVTVRIG